MDGCAPIKNFVMGASFFFSGLSSRAKVDANFDSARDLFFR